MAIVLEANYAKKLGLPNYSSHQYSVTIRTELTDLSQVEAESARLYRALQDAVDREIQEVGFMTVSMPLTNYWLYEHWLSDGALSKTARRTSSNTRRRKKARRHQ